MSLALRKFLKVSALSLAVMGLSTSAVLADRGLTALQVGAHESVATAESSLPLAGRELDVALTIMPPFAFISDSFSDVKGIDIDIIKELQKRTGFKLKNNEFNLMNFGEMVDLGREGKLDILCGGITLSEGRKAYYDFSDPYMDSALVLVTGRNGNINNIDDLRNRTLSVEAGTTAIDYFPNAESLNIKIAENPSAFMSIYAVHDKTADALVMDEPMIMFYINNWKDANLEVIAPISEPSNLGLLFKKNAEFTPVLQAAYKDMVADGTIRRIIERYMGQVVASAQNH